MDNMTKEVVRQEIIRINRSLERLDTFGIAFSSDRQELDNIKFRINFLKEHHLVTKERIEMWENTIETIEVRQESLEEERASLGDNWW